jgi:hypothetical protein
VKYIQSSTFHSSSHLHLITPPVFSTLPSLIDLQVTETIPEAILQRRLVKKGNTVVPQVLVTWSGLPSSSATWEDHNVLKTRFPTAPAWGQAISPAGGGVKTQG